jgi:hypothetical protein
MAEVTVSADPSYGPPRNVIVAHATGGSILESCEVTRIVGGAEEPIRRQPIVGVSDVTLYDYEAPYDRSSVYRIQGIERNTLSTQWTGDKNASTSTLSQDGKVVATNLFPTPRPASGDTGNTSITQTDDGFTIKTNKTYTGSGDDHNFYPKFVAAGETYHFHAEVDDMLTTTLPDISIWIGRWGSGDVSVPNTRLSSPSVIDIDLPSMVGIDRITFKCGMTAGDHVTWRRLGLYTAAEWQAMQALGVDWFDGDSFQAGTTTQYDESSSPVTLSPDTGWLIHPGNPAKSMRLPLGHITGMGDTTRRSNATRHDILGARYPIYTNPGPRYSRELSMKLRTRTADDENMLDNLLDDQIPILFNPRGVDASRLNLDPMYLQVGDVTAARYAQSLYPTSDSPQHWRDWALPCTQVDSPAVSQQAVGWTYAQLLNDNTRYQSVIISYKDYASLQAHSVKDGQ